MKFVEELLVKLGPLVAVYLRHGWAASWAISTSIDQESLSDLRFLHLCGLKSSRPEDANEKTREAGR